MNVIALLKLNLLKYGCFIKLLTSISLIFYDTHMECVFLYQNIQYRLIRVMNMSKPFSLENCLKKKKKICWWNVAELRIVLLVVDKTITQEE